MWALRSARRRLAPRTVRAIEGSEQGGGRGGCGYIVSPRKAGGESGRGCQPPFPTPNVGHNALPGAWTSTPHTGVRKIREAGACGPVRRSGEEGVACVLQVG